MEHLNKDFEQKRILITGGAGFIGGAVIRELLKNSSYKIYNVDKYGYASDLFSIKKTLKQLELENSDRHIFINIDLTNASDTESAVKLADPDYVMHLAAESHVDRSIKNPKEFINSNIIGTFNILESSRNHFNKLPKERKNQFRFQHISTDEVFGSLNNLGKFNELSRYDPRSPYSASKASSDHLVNAWFHTYELPTITTNCTNNFGPWQHPEKLIPMIISNAINNKRIPIYGDGENIRDWLFVEDHAKALLKTLRDGKIGEKYFIGANNEKTNNQIVDYICCLLDKLRPRAKTYKSLITYVQDRKGHDFRYSLDTSKIENSLNWSNEYSFESSIELTVNWYLENLNWVNWINSKKF